MKKNLKKLFLLMAVVVMAMVCLAFSAGALEATGQCGDNVYWSYNESTGELIISGSGDMNHHQNEPYVTSPFWISSVKSVVIEDGVTGIGNSTFYQCHNITSVTLPDSIKTIGEYAFYGCSGLKSIEIPDGAVSIGMNAFYNCTNLTDIIISDSVTSIGNNAFYNTGYYKNVSANWPGGVLYIGNHLIRASETITSYDVKKGTKTISDRAFLECKELEKVTIPDSVVSVGESAFRDCTSLKNIVLGNKVRRIGRYTFYNCKALTAITIPDSVTSIEQEAFGYCSSLTAITIPDNVTSIGERAFRSCTRLTNVKFGKGIKSIGRFAFDNCVNLADIKIPDSITSLNEGVFYKTGIKSITIPDSVTLIDSSAFKQCKELTSIIIPESVKTIYSHAFYECTKLKSVTIPGSLTLIGGYLFAGCTALTNVKIPDGVKKIEPYAFYNCKELTSISIGDSVTEIGKYAFSESGLKYVFYGGTEAQRSDIIIAPDGNGKINFNAVWHYKSTDHTYKTTTTKATLTANGKTETKCAECGKVKSTATIYKPTTITLSTSAYTYDGKVKTPGVTVKDSKGNTLKKGTDYKVTYESGRKNTGRYNVRIDFTGKYEGMKRLSFTIAPKTPTGIKVTRTTDAVRLTWNKVTGASGYAVFQYKSGAWTRIATITKGDTTTYRVEKLKSGTTYKFKVKAYKSDDGTIWGKATDTITAATNPATPKISSTSKSTNAVRLNWGKVTGANGYIVEQYKSGKWTRIATITKADIVTYRAEKLKSGTTYKFRVKAYKKVNGETLWSAATPTVIIKTK